MHKSARRECIKWRINSVVEYSCLLLSFSLFPFPFSFALAFLRFLSPVWRCTRARAFIFPLHFHTPPIAISRTISRGMRLYSNLSTFTRLPSGPILYPIPAETVTLRGKCQEACIPSAPLTISTIFDYWDFHRRIRRFSNESACERRDIGRMTGF